jgi:GMP synthase (glutamine-hydrolysing)
VTWTGCSLTIYHTDDERVVKQINLAREVFKYGLPQYGSCWAAQMAVVAANGFCGKNPRGREMGIARKIALSPEGRSHPMFEGKPSIFDAFTSHNDEITHIQPGGLRLAGNYFSSVQAVAVRHLNVCILIFPMILK